LNNPHEREKYHLSEKAMPAEELLARISLESKFFKGYGRISARRIFLFGKYARILESVDKQ